VLDTVLAASIAYDTDAMGYKEDLQRVHDKVDLLRQESANRSTKAAPASPWAKVSPIISGCALLLALWVAYGNHSATDLKNQISVEVNGQLKDPLKQIGDMSGDIKEIKAILALAGIQAFASVPKSELKASLPRLKKSLDFAEQQKISVSPATIKGVQEKLLDVSQDTPDYWPTVLQFLRFASAGLASKSVPASDRPIAFKSSGTTNLVDHNSFSGMVVLLDGGLIEDDVFENCRVIFTETPVHLRNVVFVNSVFEFRVSITPPPPYIQQASKILLASKLDSVSFSN
jgi:hypothetical protein